jgi:hypothetical protein
MACQLEALDNWATAFTKLVWHWCELHKGKEIDEEDYKVQWNNAAYWRWYITCQFGLSCQLSTRKSIRMMAELITNFDTKQEFTDWWATWTWKLHETEKEYDEKHYDTVELLNNCLTQ